MPNSCARRWARRRRMRRTTHGDGWWAARPSRPEEGDGDDGEAGEQLEQQIEEATDRLQRLEDGLASFGADAFQNGGAIVCAGRDGRIEVHRGLIRPEDRKAVARKMAREEGEGD